jgi:hypothetical protein
MTALSAMKRYLLVILSLTLFSCVDPGSDPKGNVVTLNLNGGTLTDNGGELKYGGAFTPTPLKEILSDLNYDPVYPGKTFAVWNTVPDGSGDDYIGDTLVEAPVTLYAIYGEVLNTREAFENILCDDPNVIYTLDREISLALGEPWEPLCANPVAPFRGRIYGKGFGISYFATRSSASERPDYAGLFAYTEGAKIMDFAMENVRITGRLAVGAVAAVARDTVIERIDVTGIVTSSGRAGGIVGEAYGSSISKSSFGREQAWEEKTVTASGLNTVTGGIAGYAEDSVITESAVSADMQVSGGNALGGIVGEAVRSTISDSLSNGTLVTSSVNTNSGGIAGRMTDSDISHCYSEANIRPSSTGASGGIAGRVSGGEITDSAAFHLSFGQASIGKIAGLLENSAQVTNAYSRYDTQLNGTLMPDSENNGIGRAVTSMRKNRNFFESELGFSLSRIWRLPDYYEYPRLKWEAAPEYTRIYTASDLRRMSQNLSGYYVLLRDIDLYETTVEDYSNEVKVVTWAPVGNETNPFRGKLDGNGHIIKNLMPHAAGNMQTLFMGLFGVTDGAFITDLKIHMSFPEVKYNGADPLYTGSVAGRIINTHIERVNITGAIASSNNTGGIAGYMENNSYILHSSFAGLIRNYENSAIPCTVGGIAGYMSESSVYYSMSAGEISTYARDESQTAGGLVGNLVLRSRDNEVFNSYSTMDVYAAGGLVPFAGGLYGRYAGTNSFANYAAGNVHASSRDYVDMMVSGLIRAGGIAGQLSSGGIQAALALENTVIADAVNVHVASMTSYAGRITSTSLPGAASAADLYALRSMTVAADITTGEAGADTPEILDQAFYESIGWDFTNIWFMPESGGYPQLQGVRP